MRFTPLLLLACAHPPEVEPTALGLVVRFDTAAPTVGRATTDATRVVWGLAADALDQEAWVTADDFRLVGLPQGRTVYVQAVDGQRRSEVVEGEVPQTGLPDLQVLRTDPSSAMAQGYVAAAILDDSRSGIAIYDGQGRAVWGWQAPASEVSASPVFAANGTDLLAFFSARDRDEDGGLIRRMPLHGEPHVETAAAFGHHTFVERPEGLVWLSRDFPVLPSPSDPDIDWNVMSDTIRHAPEGSTDGGSTVFDLLAEQPLYWPCDHFDTLHQRYGITALHDWSHANSLAWVEASASFVYGVRLHDAIYGLGPDFSVQWKLGGVDPTVVADTDLSHAHFSEAWDGGLLVFDNGAHRDPPQSRVIELAIDPIAGTATTVWEFAQPAGGFTSWLGDARRLPNGNRLLAFTELGRILEVTPDQQVVWEAQTPASFVGRIRYTPSLEALPPG